MQKGGNEAKDETVADVQRIERPVWQVTVSLQQFRRLIERLIRESQPEGQPPFELGERDIYVWKENDMPDLEDLVDAEQLAPTCSGDAFTAVVFVEEGR